MIGPSFARLVHGHLGSGLAGLLGFGGGVGLGDVAAGRNGVGGAVGGGPFEHLAGLFEGGLGVGGEDSEVLGTWGLAPFTFGFGAAAGAEVVHGHGLLAHGLEEAGDGGAGGRKVVGLSAGRLAGGAVHGSGDLRCAVEHRADADHAESQPDDLFPLHVINVGFAGALGNEWACGAGFGGMVYPARRGFWGGISCRFVRMGKG